MIGIFAQKVKSLTYKIYELFSTRLRKVTKMTHFCHQMRHIKIINLTQKYFVELLKTFLLRIRDNFYGNPTRNKKVRGKKYFTQILLYNTV